MKLHSLILILSWLSACSPQLPAGLKKVDPVPLTTVTLLTTTGKNTTEWFKGQWTLLLFGFTSCPDICPNSLGLAKKLATDKLQLGFVTVDPDRDSLEKLKEYLDFFSPDFVGIRGDTEKTLDFAKALASTFGKIPENGQLFHSVKFYLIDPEGRWVGYFEPAELGNADFPKSLASFVSRTRTL